jgi:hypothetical protein
VNKRVVGLAPTLVLALVLSRAAQRIDSSVDDECNYLRYVCDVESETLALLFPLPLSLSVLILFLL